MQCNRVESYNAPDIDSQTDLPLDVGMHDLEAAGNAKKNDGFFEKGILNAMESNSLSISNSAREVKVIANGHCHREDRNLPIFCMSDLFSQ